MTLAPTHDLAAAENSAAARSTAASGVLVGRVANTSNGLFLQNVRVVVEGTNLETFTGEGGTYRFPGLPAGSTQVRVEYTGLTPQSKTVQIQPGATAQLDFELSLIRGSAGGEQAVVKLAAFTVEGLQVSAEMMALNEQRNAPNIKNVVASDEYADGGEGKVRTLDRMIKKSNGAVGFEWKISPDNLLKVSGQYIAGRVFAGDNLQTVNFAAGATSDGTYIQGTAAAGGSISRTQDFFDEPTAISAIAKTPFTMSSARIMASWSALWFMGGFQRWAKRRQIMDCRNFAGDPPRRAIARRWSAGGATGARCRYLVRRRCELCRKRQCARIHEDQPPATLPAAADGL